jgi:tRNA (mo5U34)-methyltransferase
VSHVSDASSPGDSLAAHDQSRVTLSPELRARVSAGQWYHTIELAPDLVTPGFFDHRAVAPKILPPSLSGRRCLDVATFDGFWALQMRARSAAEVVAIDVPDPRAWDWPAGTNDAVVAAIGARKEGDGFALVTEALGYDIERIECSVYDLDPARIGQFDFIYVGSLLLHLRDPVRALERVRAVCRGELLLVENVDPITTLLHPKRPVATFDGHGRPWWWRLNLAAVERVASSAGFELIERPMRLKFPRGRGRPIPALRPSTLRDRALRTEFREALLGDSHAVLRLRPRPGLSGAA